MRRRGRLGASVIGAALVFGVVTVPPASSGTSCLQNLTASAQSDSICPPATFFKVGGAVIPGKLPKHEMAPVAVNLWGSISAGNAAQPPPLREVAIEFDRHGALDATGLPVCNPNIQFQKISQAKSICKGSIIGQGTATFEIAAPESSPMPVTGRLVIINGGLRAGVRILYAEVFLRLVTPTVVKSTLEVRKIHQGPYGLQVVGKMPIIEGLPGTLLGFSLEIKRLFMYKGKKQSFAMASCANGHLSATISAVFSTGERIAGTVTRPCESQG